MVGENHIKQSEFCDLLRSRNSSVGRKHVLQMNHHCWWDVAETNFGCCTSVQTYKKNVPEGMKGNYREIAEEHLGIVLF